MTTSAVMWPWAKAFDREAYLKVVDPSDSVSCCGMIGYFDKHLLLPAAAL